MTTHTDRERLKRKIDGIDNQIISLIQEVCEEVIGEKSTTREALPADDYERGYDHGYDDHIKEQRTRMMELLKVDSNGGEK